MRGVLGRWVAGVGSSGAWVGSPRCPHWSHQTCGPKAARSAIAMPRGVEWRDVGTCCCPQQFFLPSLQLHEKPMTLLGFALQHDLLGFGISPSHRLLPKSRRSWRGEPRFSHLLPGSQHGQGTAGPPPQNRGHYRDRGLTEIHPTKTELLGSQSFPKQSGVGIANTVVKGIRLLWLQPGTCPVCRFNLTKWHLKAASG